MLRFVLSLTRLISSLILRFNFSPCFFEKILSHVVITGHIQSIDLMHTKNAHRHMGRPLLNCLVFSLTYHQHSFKYTDGSKNIFLGVSGGVNCEPQILKT